VRPVLVGPSPGGYASGMQALFAFLALALGGANVYRWVDADGQAHYSDQPQPGAEKITINVSPPASGSARGTVGVATPTASSQAPEDETPAPVFTYQSLTITNPAQEQVLWNIEGQLDVAASVQPALQPGHVLQFYLDGRMVQAEPGSTQIRFSEVFRGEHSLRVEVADASGRTLVASPESRFFIRQTAISQSAPKPAPN
jgi:hypothetical protein